jgi:hypothetical protein
MNRRFYVKGLAGFRLVCSSGLFSRQFHTTVDVSFLLNGDRTQHRRRDPVHSGMVSCTEKKYPAVLYDQTAVELVETIDYDLSSIYEKSDPLHKLLRGCQVFRGHQTT